MGAWWTGPWDNDSVLDWLADVDQAGTPEQLIGLLQDALRRARNSKRFHVCYDEARGAAELVLLYELGGLKVEAMEALERILCDESWTKCWRSPAKIKSALRRQIDHLEKMPGNEVWLTRQVARFVVAGGGPGNSKFYRVCKRNKTMAANALGVSKSKLGRILNGKRVRPERLDRCPCCGRLTGSGSFVEQRRKLEKRLADARRRRMRSWSGRHRRRKKRRTTRLRRRHRAAPIPKLLPGENHRGLPRSKSGRSPEPSFVQMHWHPKDRPFFMKSERSFVRFMCGHGRTRGYHENKKNNVIGFRIGGVTYWYRWCKGKKIFECVAATRRRPRGGDVTYVPVSKEQRVR